MKNFICVVVLVGLLCITGCGVAKLTTHFGSKIGTTYQQAAEDGAVTAEESIQAWPYISGQIKGLMANNYDLEMPLIARTLIKELDALAAKDVTTLTTEDKGYIIGAFVRLETIAATEAWARYGVSVTNFLGAL